MRFFNKEFQGYYTRDIPNASGKKFELLESITHKIEYAFLFILSNDTNMNMNAGYNVLLGELNNYKILVFKTLNSVDLLEHCWSHFLNFLRNFTTYLGVPL